jgi:YggT family protein
MGTLLWLIDLLIDIYVYIIIATVVLSWLVSFNVVNPYNPAIRAIQNFCYAATEPLLRPIRRLMPDLGGIDISPIVLLLGVEFARYFIFRAVAGRLWS